MNLLWYIKYLGNMIIWCKFIWVDVCFVFYNWFINKRFFGRFMFNCIWFYDKLYYYYWFICIFVNIG